MLLPTQRRFLESTAKYRLYSSGYGGGKSKLGCRESIRVAASVPHTRNLVGRYTYKDLTETTMVTFFRELREIGFSDGTGAGPRHYTWSKGEMKIRWWNGSETIFSNLDDPTGAKFGSLEISTVFVDEGSEVPGEVYQVLLPGRLRWHLPSCRLVHDINTWMERHPGQHPPADIRCACMDSWRAWVCTNPGASDYLLGVVDAATDGGGQPAEDSPFHDWRVFFASPGENPYNGPDYYVELERKGRLYGEHWYKRFYEGRWDAFEGQRFPMLDEGTHLLPDSFVFHPDAWEFVSGWDFGWNAPTAQVLIAVHRNQEYPPCAVDEYEESKTEIPEHASAVRAIWESHGLRVDPLAYGDPAGNQIHASGDSAISKYAQNGLQISPAVWAKSPVDRADKLAIAFSRRVQTPSGEMAGFMFHPRCRRLFRALQQYRYAANRNKDADAREVFVKKNDHLVDALGYGFSSCWLTIDEDTSEAREAWEEMVRNRRVPTPDDLDRMEMEGRRP